ncbi:MAG: glycosyltransferase, partial [Pseudothermotoga sp.]|nr:glycosyltransferase [Pseudothermotoga sp.]
MQALLSIITPTYNMKSSLPKTIESVDELKRRYNKIQIEYVIIDGSSTDGTVEVIKKYHALGIVDEYISEKDNGVYDAM